MSALADGLHAFETVPTGLPDGPVTPLDANAWEATHPDRHLARLDGGELVARCSLWWTRPPRLPDAPDAVAGRIGHAAWTDAAAGAALIADALSVLRRHGCTHALGPMDGSTWHAYRVVTDAADSSGGTPEPPFALEPFPPVAVGEAFASAGFAPVARYLSSRVDALPDESAAVAADRARLDAAGIDVAPMDPSDAGAALDGVYAVSVEAFAGNPFYTPLPRDAFLATYRPLVPHLDPRLVLIARRADRPVGFAFGVPDLAQAARGEAVDTVVVKTVAVVDAVRGEGLGGALVRGLHHAARTAGYRRAIHALMHDANASVRISTHTAQPMRRYALLGRAL